MFDHSYSGICKYGNSCNRALCSFQHNTEHLNDQSAKLTEKEKEYELYVKTDFREVFDYFTENQKCVPCYFCDYTPKSNILKHIADELSDHMEENHEQIIAAFHPDTSNFENNLHEDFLKFSIIG